MMEDWTDIIGEELRSVEEPLPADDWGVLRQKYAAARRKKRTAAFAWTGAVASVAAVFAVFVLVFRGGPDISPDSQYVADIADTVEIRTPAADPDAETEAVPDPAQVPGPVPVHVPAQTPIKDVVAERQEEELPDDDEADSEETFHVIVDTTAVTERLIADAGEPAGESTGESAGEDGSYEYFPYEEEVKRQKVKVSLGLSGSVSGTPMLFAMMDAVPDVDLENPEPPYTGKDTLNVSVPAEKMAVMARARAPYKESYSHHVPVSFGVSARFHLTRRVSLNVGLNYTRYNSVRTRVFGERYVENDDQQVHYLGVPLRADWMFVDRKYFSMYLGAGAQVDKCVYAKVGVERLHERRFLFGVTGAMGMQVNFTPMVGLYLEPDVTYSLNEPVLETFRSRHRTMISARAGIRFTF